MYYKLDDTTPVKMDDIMKWGDWFESADRVVARTELDTDEFVSTVFLGLDHQWGEGPPLLFETLVFGGEHNGLMERYSTWELAEVGHQRIVCMVMGGIA